MYVYICVLLGWMNMRDIGYKLFEFSDESQHRWGILVDGKPFQGTKEQEQERANERTNAKTLKSQIHIQLTNSSQGTSWRICLSLRKCKKLAGGPRFCDGCLCA